MQKRKQTAWWLAGAYFVWTLVIQPIWNLNIEKLAEKNGVDGMVAEFAPMTWLQNIWSYLPSSFAAGFVAGALIFSYWDNIVAFVRNGRGKKPERDMRVWIGNMWPHFDPEHRTIELWLSLVNVGTEPLRLVRPQGMVKITSAGGTFELRNPRFQDTLDHDAVFQRANYTSMSVRFDVPAKIWAALPDMFIWRSPRTIMHLDEFSIIMAAEDKTEKVVKGWDSMRLTTGDWEICSRETFKMFESPEDKEKFQKSLGAIAKIFGTKS
jgi:hypothetical protein